MHDDKWAETVAWVCEELGTGRRERSVREDLSLGGWSDDEIEGICREALAKRPASVAATSPLAPPKRATLPPLPLPEDRGLAPRSARVTRGTIAWQSNDAKAALLTDRAAGEAQFSALMERHPEDGYPYLRRAEAREKVGELRLALDDYAVAAQLLLWGQWRGIAREGHKRVLDKLRASAPSNTNDEAVPATGPAQTVSKVTRARIMSGRSRLPTPKGD